MQKLRAILPPPNLLVAFEAAGRLLSFTKTGRELNVTRVAISQQIKALEEFLDVPLFHRLHRSLKLTQVGEQYHKSISAALEQAVRATIEASKHPDKNILNITASTGFATYWLMPNIGEFRRKHPEIELRFIVSDRYLNLAEENIDIAIRYGTPPFGTLDTKFLVQEVISPTCSPTLVTSDQAIEPCELANYPLIHLEGHYAEQTRWSNWFKIQNLPPAHSSPAISVNTYTNLVQAALDGQGFALIGPPLIKRFLDNGSLVQPVKSSSVSRHAFYMLTPSSPRQSNAATLFSTWLEQCFL